jgi:hypothetical protein
VDDKREQCLFTCVWAAFKTRVKKELVVMDSWSFDLISIWLGGWLEFDFYVLDSWGSTSMCGWRAGVEFYILVVWIMRTRYWCLGRNWQGLVGRTGALVSDMARINRFYRCKFKSFTSYFQHLQEAGKPVGL